MCPPRPAQRLTLAAALGVALSEPDDVAEMMQTVSRRLGQQLGVRLALDDDLGLAREHGLSADQTRQSGAPAGPQAQRAASFGQQPVTAVAVNAHPELIEISRELIRNTLLFRGLRVHESCVASVGRDTRRPANPVPTAPRSPGAPCRAACRAACRPRVE